MTAIILIGIACVALAFSVTGFVLVVRDNRRLGRELEDLARLRNEYANSAYEWTEQELKAEQELKEKSYDVFRDRYDPNFHIERST